MEQYNPKKIESKWQKFWEENKIFSIPEGVSTENKFYVLPQLPYPSGSGLHAGHAEVFTACDIYARYQRMKGRNVLQVFGLDSFGLPAENYAIKTNVHPKQTIDETGANFVSQVKALGCSIDWDRFIRSSDPGYYKFTQWFFLLMYEQGLAYKKKQAVNWCESCKTVLANEQVSEGHCERCNTEIIQKEMEQWYLKITKYADKLLEGLNRIDWPEETKKRQRDWIGKSEGAEIEFEISDSKSKIIVFTTRPDTLFGASYIVLAPEGQHVQELKDYIKNWDEVEAYIFATSKKTYLDRQVNQEKTGVKLEDVKAINPASGEEISIWIADYVIATYGTGAIMAVPAHDERDFAFAKKFDLPIKHVVAKKVNRRLKNGITRHGVYGICVRDGMLLTVFNNIENEYQLPGGGIKDGESEQFALLREIIEETGYADVEVGKHYGVFEYSYEYPRKQLNRQLYSSIYEIFIKSEGIIDRSDLEKNKLCVEWVAFEDLEKVLKGKMWGGIIREAFGRAEYGKEIAFTEYGVSINSDFINGLATEEAKTVMVEWLERGQKGRRRVQYKLCDWSVSRQRFWGAPLPMLVNQQLAISKKQYVFIHGYGGSADSNFFLWLKIELERQGHSVVALDLPNTDKPNVQEQADFLKERVEFGENTVIIAHSLGGSVAMRILESLNSPICKTIFADPVLRPYFNDGDRPDVIVSDSFQFDFNYICKNSGEVTIIYDANHITIKKEHIEELSIKLRARKISLSLTERHLMVLEIPEILEEAVMTGVKPLNFSDLPVVLPEDVDFKPTGQSPLVYSPTFQNGVEEKYGKGWKREVNTLDTFMCSSWYFFRYLDPHNDNEFSSQDALKNWMPVDFYLGGPEHVNGHLLYARFFTKVLFDAGYIDFDEPFLVHRHQGLILGSDGRKMSKRWENVINPTDVIGVYGADTMRMYEMFMGSLEEDKPWDENGIKGIRRFLDRVWRLQDRVNTGDLRSENVMQRKLHETIKKVGEDLDSLGFNTAIAKLMELVNEFYKVDELSIADYMLLIRMLTPFAPHIAEEIWQNLGNKEILSSSEWPIYDEQKLVSSSVTLGVQVNGRLRATIEITNEDSEYDVKNIALSDRNVQKWLEGKKPKKIIYVKGKIINVVV